MFGLKKGTFCIHFLCSNFLQLLWYKNINFDITWQILILWNTLFDTWNTLLREIHFFNMKYTFRFSHLSKPEIQFFYIDSKLEKYGFKFRFKIQDIIIIYLFTVFFLLLLMMMSLHSISWKFSFFFLNIQFYENFQSFFQSLHENIQFRTRNILRKKINSTEFADNEDACNENLKQMFIS